MVVEALYWFHPAVWWIEARLVDERERACDEEVLRMGSDPGVYAEGILNVCRFYAESPVICASGVTGSDLKKRIEAIMRNRTGDALNVWKKLLLVATAVVALAVPVGVGVLNAPLLRAQSRPAAAGGPGFEVASVKPNKSGNAMQGFGFPGDRFEATNVLLHDLVALAYGDPGQVLPDSQLSGGPNWIDSDRFDIKATVGSDGPNTAAQKQFKLRALSAERFHLVVHEETRDLPIYALVLARSDRKLGPKLLRADVDCEALLAEQPGQRKRCVLNTLPSGDLIVCGQT